MIHQKLNTAQDWLNVIPFYHTKEREFLSINNADGSIRWIWPASCSKPTFLNFYSATTWKSKLFCAAVKSVFNLGLQRVVFKKSKANFDKFPMDYGLNESDDWAIFTGTKGPNRKLLLTGTSNSGESCFLKIAVGKNAKKLIKQEINQLESLNRIPLKKIITPKVLNYGENFVQISDISTETRTSTFGMLHIEAFSELQLHTGSAVHFKHTEFYADIKQRLATLNHKSDIKVPNAMCRKLNWLLDSISPNETIETSFAHGDFTPWNCFVTENQLCIYDLEMSKMKLPIGFDAFHFIIQNGILVQRQNWSEIKTKLEQTIGKSMFRGDTDLMNKYLKLYLLTNISTYLVIYEQQTEWHTQVTWLLNTWNDALSSMLQEQVTSRELVLMDIFDFVQNNEYVALKFKGYLPEQVSTLSDVDLCISKKEADRIYQYISKHSLVKSCRRKKLSFMQNQEIILNNNEFISLDCIWKLKRKSLVMMDIDRLLKSHIKNSYGIKQPSMHMESLYINIFHLLNNSRPKLDQRNKSFELELEDAAGSTSRRAMKNALISILKIKKANKGLNRVANTSHYISDTLRNLVTRRGFIVTFSGVDGAGKSTLIEITKRNIDKQLRRPVVVLRHRPSLLPILSAWSMGKEAAEQKAADTLPRQGKNNSIASSLVRFAYYYSDYFFGQFYIYFKYVLRGKVVVYDRYYFDFINDSKRSNINLPNWLTTFGYNFILKPEVNFFLYADAETILARKQELDAKTIESLTEKYLTLFEKLNKRDKQNRYHPVKNLILEDTVDSIMSALRVQAA